MPESLSDISLGRVSIRWKTKFPTNHEKGPPRNTHQKQTKIVCALLIDFSWFIFPDFSPAFHFHFFFKKYKKIAKKNVCPSGCFRASDQCRHSTSPTLPKHAFHICLEVLVGGRPKSTPNAAEKCFQTRLYGVVSARFYHIRVRFFCIGSLGTPQGCLEWGLGPSRTYDTITALAVFCDPGAWPSILNQIVHYINIVWSWCMLPPPGSCTEPSTI